MTAAAAVHFTGGTFRPCHHKNMLEQGERAYGKIADVADANLLLAMVPTQTHGEIHGVVRTFFATLLRPKSAEPHLSKEALAALERYDWREQKHLVPQDETPCQCYA